MRRSLGLIPAYSRKPYRGFCHSNVPRDRTWTRRGAGHARPARGLRSSNLTDPWFAACGCAAASTSGRSSCRFSHSGNSRLITPPPSPLPRPVMTSTTRNRSAWALPKNACSAKNARCAVRPCRSKVRPAGSLLVRNRLQVELSTPGGCIPTTSSPIRCTTGAGGAAGSVGVATPSSGAGGAGGVSGRITPSSGATFCTYPAQTTRSASDNARRRDTAPSRFGAGGIRRRGPPDRPRSARHAGVEGRGHPAPAFARCRRNGMAPSPA